MKIGNHDLSETDHFIAMEYCWLILNRTYMLLLDERYLVGAKVNGLVSAGNDPLAIRGGLENPYSYVSERYIQELSAVDLLSNALLQVNPLNFKIKYTEIESVEYTPKKKWGMAHYPHDGRVFIASSGKRREFIIMGNQSGSEICSAINRRVEHAKET